MIVPAGRGRGRGPHGPPPMTARCVKQITKRGDQHRDDRSLITKVKPCWNLPKVTIEPKSNITVGFQAAAWAQNNTDTFIPDSVIEELDEDEDVQGQAKEGEM